MGKPKRVCWRNPSNLAVSLVLLLTSSLFADDYFGVDTTRTPLASITALTQEFLAQRAQIEPIYPYDICQFTHPVWQPILTSPDDLPTAFRRGLIGIDHGGCNVYPVTCIQIRALKSIVFVNAEGAVFDSVPYTDDTVWNRSAWSDNDYLRWQDPARVGITLNLVTADDLATADAAAELQAEFDAVTSEIATEDGGDLRQVGMRNMYSMQSLLDATYHSLVFAGIQRVTNGLELTIGLPDGWANRLDVLVSDDLGPFIWRWQALLLDATNGVSFAWVDTNAPAIDRTFYVLGNADIDSDGDGLSDAIEIYVTKTCPTNPDTDGDGLSDGWEIGHGMNPNLDESAQTSGRMNYQYDGSGWLRAVSGARNESITLDDEANVQQLP